MTTARLSAHYCESGHRVILRLTAPPVEGGTLAIETVSLRDPNASARAAAFVERADALVQDGALDALYTDPDAGTVLAEAFGV